MTSGFFSGSETGMMSLNRYRLRHLARKGHRSAKRVKQLLNRPDRLLGIILIGNTFANILASSVATLLAVHYAGERGIAIATLLLTFVVLIFAEIAPKTVAALYPERVAFTVVWPLTLLLYILYPFIWLSTNIANAFLFLFGIRVATHQAESLSHEELHSVISDSGSRIPKAHWAMLMSVFDLEKLNVEDIMVPRHDIAGIDLNDPWETILEQLTNSQYTRLPVYDHEVEHIIGTLHLRIALNLMAQDQLDKARLRKVLDEPLFIPEGTSLNRQLLHFRSSKNRAGYVVDEYGRLQGLITLEDILEEIVGEFTTDVAQQSKDVHVQKDGSYLVDGTATLRDLKRSMNWDFPMDGPKTLSGLIIQHLQDIPNAGIGMHIAGYPVEVIQMQRNCVKTVRIYPHLKL